MVKRVVYSIVLWVMISSLVRQGYAFKCGVDHMKEHEYERIKVHSEKSLRSLGNTYAPIRIYIDAFQSDDGLIVADEVKSLASKVLTSTVEMIQALIQVIPLTQQLSSAMPTCGETTISSIVANGLDTDLILIPRYSSTLGSNVEAAASFCAVDDSTGRPLIGQLLINPSYVTIKPNVEYFLQMLFFHELTHVLVFHPVLYPAYLKPDGSKYGNAATIQAVVNGVTRNKLATPKVIEAAKKHFGCDTIDGVELENQGGNGSAGSHWESRIMLGDYMMSSDYGEVAISEITLALFQDSGWYQVNKYTGGLFRFGKNQGCPFLYTKCIIDSLPLSNNDYCTVKAEDRCFSSRTARGLCYLTSSSPTITAPYEYFPNPSMGGFSAADYCPITYTNTNKDYYLSTNCQFGQVDTTLASFGEVLGKNSVCVLSSLSPTSGSSSLTAPNAMCLPITCSETTLSIKILDTAYNCPREGGIVTNVPGFDGQLYCPDYNLVCTGTKWCNDVIDCVNSQSETKTLVYDYVPQLSQLGGQVGKQTVSTPNTPSTLLSHYLISSMALITVLLLL